MIGNYTQHRFILAPFFVECFCQHLIFITMGIEPSKKVSLPFSWKSIPVPSPDLYRKQQIVMAESLIKRMRFFSCEGSGNKFILILKCGKSRLVMNELKASEDNPVQVIQNGSFESQTTALLLLTPPPPLHTCSQSSPHTPPSHSTLYAHRVGNPSRTAGNSKLRKFNWTCVLPWTDIWIPFGTAWVNTYQTKTL